MDFVAFNDSSSSCLMSQAQDLQDQILTAAGQNNVTYKK
jgi:hypothetical protein